jgi:E1A/CREB-binding protein
VNGGWRTDADVGARRKMIAKIVALLQQRKPNAPQEWLKKLPQMAKRLEESLYRNAPSFDSYNDVATLKQRLQQLAMNIGLKTAAQKAQAAAGGAAPPGGQPQQRTMVNMSQINPALGEAGDPGAPPGSLPGQQPATGLPNVADPSELGRMSSMAQVSGRVEAGAAPRAVSLTPEPSPPPPPHPTPPHPRAPSRPPRARPPRPPPPEATPRAPRTGSRCSATSSSACCCSGTRPR